MSANSNMNAQLEHLQSRYVGTGHADTNKFEMIVTQHRDSYASYVGHTSLLSYFAVAQNESVGRARFNMLEKMLQPCGPPVVREDD
ncbi:splicing factor 3B subunit 5-like protein [Cladochytrium replicatum]|nr:splicing factor 3B subunit 5-like protein [Cladochytrium replicatum]